MGTYGNFARWNLWELRRSSRVFSRCKTVFNAFLFSESFLHYVFELQDVFTLSFCDVRRYLHCVFLVQDVFCIAVLSCIEFSLRVFMLCCVFALCFFAVLRFSAMILLHVLSQNKHFLIQGIRFLSHSMRQFVKPQRVFQRAKI